MNQISRYVFGQLLWGTIFVALGLVCVLWLTQSLRFVEVILNKGQSLGMFLLLTLMLVPNFISIASPVALFSVLLFIYNKLNMDRELVVMRAAGLSQFALAYPAILLAVSGTLLGYFLNIFIVPDSVRVFRELQWSIRNDLTQILLQEGTFNNIAKNITVYVKSRGNDGELLGVFVHDEREGEKSITMMAERGALVNTGGAPRVLLVNGSRQEVSRDGSKLAMLYFDSHTVEFGNLGKTEEGERFRDARERSIGELFAATPESVGAVDFARFRVEAHQRLSSPLFHLSLTLIATACLLSGSFSRHGQTGKVLSAIALMVVLEALSLGISNLAVKSLHLTPLIYINHLLAIILALGFLLAPPSFWSKLKEKFLPERRING